jgi:hypothetical protein
MLRGRAMFQAAIHWSVTAEGPVPFLDKFVWDMWHTKWHWNSPFSEYFSFPFSHSNNALYSFIYLFIYLFIYHRRYIILTICTLVASRAYKTRTYKFQGRLTVIFSKSIHTYTLIHSYIHIHSTDPVSASIISEYATCH